MARMTEEHKRKMAEGRALARQTNTRIAKQPRRLAISQMPPCVSARLSAMPETCKKTYEDAMTKNRPTLAIRAFCQMCLGWEDFREGIRGCSDQACPLYPYRPYK